MAYHSDDLAAGCFTDTDTDVGIAYDYEVVNVQLCYDTYVVRLVSKHLVSIQNVCALPMVTGCAFNWCLFTCMFSSCQLLTVRSRILAE